MKRLRFRLLLLLFDISFHSVGDTTLTQRCQIFINNILYIRQPKPLYTREHVPSMFIQTVACLLSPVIRQHNRALSVITITLCAKMFSCIHTHTEKKASTNVHCNLSNIIKKNVNSRFQFIWLAFSMI